MGVIRAGGDVRVTVNQTRYERTVGPRYSRLDAGDVRVPSRDEARAQPSLLLDARLGLVPFLGRERELAWLAAWRDQSEPAGAVLVHGPGGAGKTRLARRFGELSAEAGWAVWQVGPEGFGPVTPPSTALIDGGDKGILLLIDYAERWPAPQLAAVVRDELVATPGLPVRVLMLARSAGAWWQALSHLLHREGSIQHDRLLSGRSLDDVELASQWAAARDRFATALAVPDAGALTPEPFDGDARLMLGVHMAALVAVDARLHRVDAPADPARLSAYLLRRERSAWQALAPDGAEAIGRTVYTAALVGPLSYRDGQAALRRTGLAATTESALALLDRHQRLYPSAAGGALQPLYPDRLAEDFVALSTPGHDRTDLTADPWAADIPEALLTSTDSESVPPAWSSSGVTVLVETSRRWPHVRTGQLYPLVREHPHLIAAAGSAALATLVDFGDLAPTDLDRLADHLAEIRDYELEPVLALIEQRVAARRLAADPDPAESAKVRLRLGRRHLAAGRPEAAIHELNQAAEALGRPEPGPGPAG